MKGAIARVMVPAIVLAAFCGEVQAQDFAAAVPVMGEGALSLIEHGVAATPPGAAFEGGVVRWLGIDDFTTRSLAVSGRWRSLTGAAGLSATGGDEGWRSAGIASGYAGSNAGAALRAVFRQDAAPEAIETPLGRGAGLEAGTGAWIRPRPGLDVWASHPQIYMKGAAPPLNRGLETGIRLAGDGISAWLARRAAGGREARHRGGVALEFGTVASAWIEARDDPLRTGYGIEARSRLVAVAFALETHPVLGETARLSLAIGGAPGGP